MITILSRNSDKLKLIAEDLTDRDIQEKLRKVEQFGLWAEVNDLLNKILGDK